MCVCVRVCLYSKSLVELDISKNRFAGPLPWAAITTCVAMQELCVFGNNLNGTIPDCIANMHALKYLSQSNAISYITPLVFKMAQNPDLRCFLVPAPWVLGPKHVSNPE